MKKLLFLFTMLAFMVACSDDDNGDKQITLPNPSEQNQTAFANEETTGTFQFIAKSAWTATLTENTLSRSSNVTWLSLLLNGEETYSGAAGNISLTIKLEPNYSGEERSATITITCGSDSISIIVTQDGKTEEGKLPDNPEVSQKQINKIVYTSTNDPTPTITNITYNANGRFSVIEQTGNDGAGTSSRCEYIYSSDKIIINEKYTNSESTGTGKTEIALNTSGQAIAISSFYKLDNEIQGEENAYEIEYKNGYLYKVTDYDEVEGGLVDRIINETSTCEWDANGNMSKTILTYYNDNGEYLSQNIQTAEYGTYKNNFAIDIHSLVSEMYITGVSGSMIADVFGKRCTNLVSKCVVSGPNLTPTTITYDYTFDSNGLLVKVTTIDDNGWKGIFELTYK